MHHRPTTYRHFRQVHRDTCRNSERSTLLPILAALLYTNRWPSFNMIHNRNYRELILYISTLYISTLRNAIFRSVAAAIVAPFYQRFLQPPPTIFQERRAEKQRTAPHRTDVSSGDHLLRLFERESNPGGCAR